MTRRLRMPGWLLLAGASTACATTRPCGPWKDKPDLGPSTLAAVGTAAVGPDDAAVARQSGLAGMAAQLSVSVTSARHVEESASSSGDNRSSVTSEIQARSSVTLEGVQVVDTCVESGTYFALLALDRRRYAVDMGGRIDRDAARQAADIARAEKAAASGHHLDAALAYWRMAPDAARIDSDARMFGVVAGRPPEARWTSAGQLRARAASEAARVRFVLDGPASRFPRLHDAVMECLGRSGITLATDKRDAEAVLSLTTTFDPPPRRLPGSHLLRASLLATLKKADGESSASSARAEVKSDGADEDSSQQDAVRRLAVEKLPPLLDQLFKTAGWALSPCAGATPP